MLAIASLSYRVAGRLLLEDASARIPDGHRVGLVGPNGAGKSTLLRLITGDLAPESGTVAIEGKGTLGYVRQEAPSGATTPLDAVLAIDTERTALLEEAETATDPHRIAEVHARLVDIDAHAAPARAAGILAGLGFDAEMQARPLSSFSGGWRMRVALAGVLFMRPDLLLLDEPTNHLDLEATIWLEDHLRSYPGTLIVVSHDRHVLNAVVTHILHLDDRRLVLYPGSYDQFERIRRERQVLGAAMAAKQETRRKHLQAFVDRFRYKASKARQAQSRVKALEKMQPVATVGDDPTLTLTFPDPGELKPPLVTFDKVDVGYQPGQPILRRIELRLDPEDRIALLGANGNGKTTLARLFAGRLQPMAGHATRAPRLSVGFFAQHQIEDLSPRLTARQQLGIAIPDATTEQLRARLGRFGLAQDKAETPIEALSGGEKARLALAIATHHAPHLLILDEPTNHLDIPAREALVEAINGFAGAVILVTHDWHLIELTADRLWLVRGGKVTPFDGDLDDYRRTLAADTTGDRSGSGGADPRKAARQANAERRRALEPLRRQARTAEEEVHRLTQERARIDAALADPAVYGDPARLAALGRERAALTQRLDAAETRWLEAAQALEEASEVA